METYKILKKTNNLQYGTELTSASEEFGDNDARHPSLDESCQQPDQVKGLDSGWAWVMLMSVSLCYSLYGISASEFALFFPIWVDVFQEDKGTVVFIDSVRIISSAISSLFAGPLLDTFGFKSIGLFSGILMTTGQLLSAYATSTIMMCFTYGILIGIGMGIGVQVVQITTQLWFEKYRSFAGGICFSFRVLGYITLSTSAIPLMNWLAWRGTFVFLACLQIQGLVLSSLMRRSPRTPELEKESFCEKVKKTLKKLWVPELFRKPVFWLMTLSWTLNLGGGWAFNQVLPTYVEDGLNFTEVQAHTAFFWLFLTAPFGAVFGGIVGNLKYVNRLFLTSVLMIFTGLAGILLPILSKTIVNLSILTGIFGFFRAAATGLMATNTIDTFGFQHGNHAQGVIYMTALMLASIFVPLGVWLYQITGNYQMTLFLYGAMEASAGILFGIIFIFKQKLIA